MRIRIFGRYVLGIFLILGLVSVLIQILSTSSSYAATVKLVSVSSDGVRGNARSLYPSISGDGRYVAFCSAATNLVSDDTNGKRDVFVHDRKTGTTERVSISSDGVQANNDSCYGWLSISSDGRYVAFDSRATNLVTDDISENYDVFVHDRETGSTERVSVNSDGTELGGYYYIYTSISADGRYVAFDSIDNGLYIHDRESKVTEFVRNGSWPSISGDGRYVAFCSESSNLVSDDTNGKRDVFVYDRETGTIERVSVSSDGTQGNNASISGHISSDGRYVTFASWATNLVDGDTNGYSDIFVHDRETGITERVSVNSNGVQGNEYVFYDYQSINSDGRYVVFKSRASNLVTDKAYNTGLFIRDRETGTTEAIRFNSCGYSSGASSSSNSISSDGRYVAFQAYLGMSEIYVYDRYGTSCDKNQSPTANAGSDQTVSCSGSDGAQVTLDGSGSSDPDGDTLTYTWTGIFGTAEGVGPTVQIPLGTYTITLKVDDGNGGTAEDTVNITVEDKTPPSTTATITGTSGNNEWYKSDVNVNLASTDNCAGCKEIHYTLNGSETVVSGSTADILINTDGTYSLNYWAVDNADNIEQEKTLEIKVDKTPPTISATANPSANANGWNNTDVTVSFTCDDTTSGIASCTSATTVTTEGAGQSVTGDAVDNAGNTATTSVELNIDKTAPTTNATVSGIAGNNGWYVSNVQVTLTATDNEGGSGVNKTEYSLDGLTWNTYSSTLTISNEGTTTVYYRSTDNADNIETQKSISINIDKTVPTITTVTATPSTLWPPNHKMVDVTIDGSASDDSSGIESIEITVTDEYGKYNMTVPEFGSTIQLEAWREGTDKDGRVYTITVVATDKAGNKTTATTEVVCPHDMSDK